MMAQQGTEWSSPDQRQAWTHDNQSSSPGMSSIGGHDTLPPHGVAASHQAAAHNGTRTHGHHHCQQQHHMLRQLSAPAIGRAACEFDPDDMSLFCAEMEAYAAGPRAASSQATFRRAKGEPACSNADASSLLLLSASSSPALLGLGDGGDTDFDLDDLIGLDDTHDLSPAAATAAAAAAAAASCSSGGAGSGSACSHGGVVAGLSPPQLSRQHGSGSAGAGSGSESCSHTAAMQMHLLRHTHGGAFNASPNAACHMPAALSMARAASVPAGWTGCTEPLHHGVVGPWHHPLPGGALPLPHPTPPMHSAHPLAAMGWTHAAVAAAAASTAGAAVQYGGPLPGAAAVQQLSLGGHLMQQPGVLVVRTSSTMHPVLFEHGSNSHAAHSADGGSSVSLGAASSLPQSHSLPAVSAGEQQPLPAGAAGEVHPAALGPLGGPAAGLLPEGLYESFPARPLIKRKRGRPKSLNPKPPRQPTGRPPGRPRKHPRPEDLAGLERRAAEAHAAAAEEAAAPQTAAELPVR